MASLELCPKAGAATGHDWRWLYKGASPDKLICARCETVTASMTPEAEADWRKRVEQQKVADEELVLRITNAYEQGVGHAERPELENPYSSESVEFLAYGEGRERGLEIRKKDKEET
jgi:hypothetical protein